ncbi:MAG TPA: mercuric reductase [Phycisphaerae bacterium]
MSLVLEMHPLDEHNRALLANVHPPDWVNPKPAPRYNLVVIGAGAGGLVSAIGAAALGARVALIEKHLLGGDCLNVGCVPSKALLRCGRAFADVRDAGQFGVHVPEGVRVDFAAVMERMRRLRAKLSTNDGANRLRDAGVDVFLGAGRFVDSDAVEVAGNTLRFSRAIIATGARAAAPLAPGLEATGYLTNETVFWLTGLPGRLAVIGAGPLGCELAQAFARFGSQVHLIEALHGIMPNEDPDASAAVQRGLERDGIKLLCCGKQLTAARQPDGKRLMVDSHGEHYDLIVDEILIGVGRRPNVENLGLQAAGVEFDKNGVKVNDYLQTSNRRIYAVGDICSKYKFTHLSDAHARMALRNALFFGRAKASALTLPWCTYTDPEIAHVGLYARQAQERGLQTDEYRIALSEVDRAILDGEEDGLLKVLVREGSDRIVGATLVARHAGETISEVSAVMEAGGGLRTLSRTIHPYPTQAEVFRKAGDAQARTALTPLVKRILSAILAWRR